MRWRNWSLLLGLTSGAMFTYGMLYESRRIVLERRQLYLADWPAHLAGFRIAVISDLHLRGAYSVELAQHAVALALEERPDMVVFPGDFVDYWKPQSESMLSAVLTPLLLMEGRAVAVPGNHDYYHQPNYPRLASNLADFGIRCLRNEVWECQGISWVGIDSAFSPCCDPVGAMAQVTRWPAISLWHEPDPVARLPKGCSLQISGHSHGGQFRFPFGITPAHSKLGKVYVEGFYPNAPTPLYVSRGVGTTGPPSRFLCPPEVSLLTLSAA